jgi:hypothetical protein
MTLESYANCSRCMARLSVVVGRQHSSRIGFSVAADINSNVVDFYFLVWSLSRLLCCVGSGSSVAMALPLEYQVLPHRKHCTPLQTPVA